ncbi:MOSC domain-containing protein [Thermasporomyces composti]|jgi:MOSC domain-containing protein YiiM|uniref:MOSC domain-containing protein YiiM n=1 Tax=Thermasporomyces composti TaxID=696763 RepID=A0A3D9VFC5_THECX|nr:MOSC domain-containing protein [Thermasporomyces composti]REF36844.1 MOSC domain-containing protein YiiM [Thermasporomyces composti]
MAVVASVNLGKARHLEGAGVTGIDKRPVAVPVFVRAPGQRPDGAGSGLVGDVVCDRREHGGDDQAVYAYAREDLDWWAAELGRELANGSFGENLTTSGLDVTGALIGERWRVGAEVVLEVTKPRIPCSTFAAWLGERGWVKTFTQRAVPGAYLRVVRPGWIRAGDEVEVVERPDHDVTIGLVFRALTLEPELLQHLVRVDSLPDEIRDRARRRLSGAST